jgi:hypothetical protein
VRTRRQAEDAEQRVLDKKFSDLCELGASVVNTSSQETRNDLISLGMAMAERFR